MLLHLLQEHPLFMLYLKYQYEPTESEDQQKREETPLTAELAR